MASTSFLQRFDEQLQCPVCLDQFSEPKILSCHHTFCLRCLESMTPKSENKKQFIKCPTCSKHTHLPEDGGSRKLPNDFRTISLIDLKSHEGSNQEFMHCTVHNNQQLKFFCLTCQEVACCECVVIGGYHKDHDYKSVLDCYHEQVREIDSSYERLQRKISLLETAKTVLTETEEELLAQEKNIHKGIHEHALNLIKGIQQSEKELQDQLESIVQRKMNHLSMQKKEAEKSLEQLHKCESVIEDTLKLKARNFTSVLGKKKTIMKKLEKTNRYQSSMFVPVEKANIVFEKTNLDVNIGSLSSDELDRVNVTPLNASYNTEEKVTATLTFISRDEKPFIVNPLSVSCILISPHDNEAACQVVQEESSYSISFVAVHSGKHRLVVKVGGIEISGSSFGFHVAPTPQTRTESLGSIGNLRQPTDVATFSNGTVIVVEQSAHCISVFRKEQKRGRITYVKDISYEKQFPYGVAIFEDYYIIITQRHKVQKLLITGQVITEFGGNSPGSKNNQLNDPMGLAVKEITGQVFVADSGNNRIQVFNKDLVQMSTIERHGLVFGSLDNPCGVAVDDKGYLYVSLLKDNCVVKLDTAGWLQASYGNTRDTEPPGKLKEPSSIAISLGYLYVTEGGKNNRLSVFDIALQKFVCFVGEFITSTPSAITADSYGNLYVCDKQNVTIF